jgi:hypothetical protein
MRIPAQLASDSSVMWSAVPAECGPGLRWELVQFLEVDRNGGPIAGMPDHITVTMDRITGIEEA